MTKDTEPEVVVEELAPHKFWATCRACSTIGKHRMAYHPEAISKGPRLICEGVNLTVQKGAVIRLPKHLHRCCMTCGYEWMEEIIDG